ncbi:MAG: hypothetical protein V2J55_04485, partial [Candidatus Competibacteraceae bacterium]|nr:hypothetical protein [Candidatus Competibacteraceae bacterium]
MSNNDKVFPLRFFDPRRTARTDSEAVPEQPDGVDHARRKLLKGLGTVGVATASAAGSPAWGGATLKDTWGDFFQDHYQRMSPDEIQAALGRIERRAKQRYGVDIQCENPPPQPGVVFGYAINISRCQGYRDCVSACVEENNHGRDPESTQYIRVLEMDQGSRSLERSEHYYDPET